MGRTVAGDVENCNAIAIPCEAQIAQLRKRDRGGFVTSFVMSADYGRNMEVSYSPVSNLYPSLVKYT
jgi:hypothetical protein